ncbi:LysR family transcriptional regulator [Pseudomonas sp. PB120]|uniref:LysR family transcriptional regulator n=1 Tax=Pseudomonas sp. PB120 TaxID=2494700 RepID=UPI0012FDD608|nr:LysR family transcriptional regulator [Pseudomonas sp. PB120]MVV50179.1 LysR family transcriptional regulator [Pseudomonas sp. PB120]
MRMLDWDDLRFFLVAVDFGSYQKAAKALGVNRTTVGRRVEELEKCVGSPLFRQSASGYHPTEAGLEVLKCARQLEKHIAQLTKALVKNKESVEGHVRVAIAAELGSDLLPEVMKFQQKYAEVTVEILIVCDPVIALTQRKADIALGVLRSKPEYLSGRCLGGLSRAVYGAAGASHPSVDSAQLNWVGWSESMKGCMLASWMSSNVKENARIASWVDSWAALKAATQTGNNVAVMWQAFAEPDQGLVQLPGFVTGQGADLWLLSLEAMPLDACKQEMFEFLSSCLKQKLTNGPGFIPAEPALHHR